MLVLALLPRRILKKGTKFINTGKNQSQEANHYVCKYGANFADEEAAEPVKKPHIVSQPSDIHSKQL